VGQIVPATGMFSLVPLGLPVIPFYVLKFRHLINAKVELVGQACRRKGRLSVIDMESRIGLAEKLRRQQCGQMG
jgi:hypothetical protein